MKATPRLAREGDAGEIARLAGELGYPCTERTMAARLAVLAAEPRQRVWVVEHAGGLAGWLAAERRVGLEADERVEIGGLVVDPAIQRGGVGRALVAAAEAWARSEGLDTVVVRSNVRRGGSHPFYEALGYQRRKSQHVYAKTL